jgi:hypothetical protein
MITDSANPAFLDWAETNYFAFFNAEFGCGHLQRRSVPISAW